MARLLLVGGALAAPGGCVGGPSKATSASESDAAASSGGGSASGSEGVSSTSAGATATAGSSDSTGAAPTTTGAPPGCGDGHVDPGEECDDGDEFSDDECTVDCTVARCGDGYVHIDVEACDDGNLDDNDGCSSECKVLPQCLYGYCEATPETCPIAAQVNADVQGVTPLGAFTGTFAAFNGAIAFGVLGDLEVLPAYTDGDICEVGPRLSIALGAILEWGTYTAEMPVRFYDSEGAWVDAIGTVTVNECCKSLWFCSCANDDPFTIDLLVEGEGWSLSGSAAPNCCRSYSIDEAA